MTLRLHLAAEDLLRTRFAPTPAPLLELGLALAVLQRDDPVFHRWRTDVHRRLPAAARPLTTLVPPTGAGPVFLDPVSDGLDDGLDTVMSTPAPVVHRELRRVFERPRRVTSWVRDLDVRDRDAWSVLSAALVLAHGAVIEPDGDRLAAAHRAEVAVRSRVVARSGLRHALAGIYREATWQGTVLHLPSTSDRDLHLGGRGLTLQPSVYWTGPPLFCDHPDGSLLLVHPAVTPLPLVDAAAGDAPLATLVGATRAAVLRAARTPSTTSELAAGLGISLASASEHARTLRDAGLVDSVRDGRSVLHCVTPLGEDLLTAAA